jgi:uncharacterized protein
MKVHILQIPPEGKHVEGEEPSAMLELHDPTARPVSPVHYSLDVGLSGGGLFATGEVGVDMKLQCVKCLEDFDYPIELNDFACQIELGATETVDLTDPVREDILLALPAHPHCDWDGKRTCPGTLPKKASEPEQDAIADTRDTWGALDQIKFRS